MKKYNTPDCKIVALMTEDVISVSGYGEVFSWYNPTSTSGVDAQDEMIG